MQAGTAPDAHPAQAVRLHQRGQRLGAQTGQGAVQLIPHSQRVGMNQSGGRIHGGGKAVPFSGAAALGGQTHQLQSTHRIVGKKGAGSPGTAQHRALAAGMGAEPLRQANGSAGGFRHGITSVE